ncbi:glycoside hydrolase family 3 protein [[Clostridium] polysaccharolyticum]|uniref:beta-N-acetylhexosaminidase n=1 Tax=[Clostridium] polysaccharolyticum TaxID=29364 RepID=A0A1H9ZNZ4_9FIRM|nr:glycoside hydrolase family 3 protein [[Clostridium] polysaccharolyticum]SES83065.1 beta-N-acetylhexosaminidase [[Clostridium] polysaccharolyticum]
MKKLFFLVLAVSLIVTGCGKEKPSKEQVDPIKPTKEVSASLEPEASSDASDNILTDSSEITGLAKMILAKMSLEEKIGQMFLVNLESLDDSKGTYFEHREVTKKMKRNLKDFPVGGVILFSRNIETREQTIKLNQDLQKNSKIPLWTAVDEEGGDIARIANNPNMKTTQFPPMEIVGATEDAEYCYNMGKTIGSEISELGFNLDFAPVADVRTNEKNKEIGNRSFGNKAESVAEFACAVVKGMQKTGVSATLKHFPGHGDAQGDTHQSSVNIGSDINRLRTVDFVPFQEGIKAGADFIMISHISISRIAGNTLPASLSSLVMKDIVRRELRFNGVVITDAMDMKAITGHYQAADAALMSIKAGADVVLMPENFVRAYNRIVNAVINKELTESRIDESVQRILETKIKRGLILRDTELIYKK